jgi:hypothetical protein
MRGGWDKRYIAEAKEGAKLPLGDSYATVAVGEGLDAHRCWTGAVRTPENSVRAKFAEFSFHDVRE